MNQFCCTQGSEAWDYFRLLDMELLTTTQFLAFMGLNPGHPRRKLLEEKLRAKNHWKPRPLGSSNFQEWLFRSGKETEPKAIEFLRSLFDGDSVKWFDPNPGIVRNPPMRLKCSPDGLMLDTQTQLLTVVEVKTRVTTPMIYFAEDIVEYHAFQLVLNMIVCRADRGLLFYVNPDLSEMSLFSFSNVARSDQDYDRWATVVKNVNHFREMMEHGKFMNHKTLPEVLVQILMTGILIDLVEIEQ